MTMRSLTIEYVEDNYVRITANMTLKTGKEFYLCDSWDELVEAMEAGMPFLGHDIKGMRPNDMVVNPEHVATIQRGQ